MKRKIEDKEKDKNQECQELVLIKLSMMMHYIIYKNNQMIKMILQLNKT